MQTSQRWYCKRCNTRYRAKFGVIIEIIRGGKALYCKSDCPTEHIKDAKAMAIERNTAAHNHATPESLYAALLVMRPMDQGAFLEATEQVGHYQMDLDHFYALPELKWADIFAMVLNADQGNELVNRFIITTGAGEGPEPAPLLPS